MAKPGGRVAAISHADENTAYLFGFFGYGVYEGDKVPPPGVTFMGVPLAELGLTTPKIKKCWWGG